MFINSFCFPSPKILKNDASMQSILFSICYKVKLSSWNMTFAFLKVSWDNIKWAPHLDREVYELVEDNSNLLSSGKDSL